MSDNLDLQRMLYNVSALVDLGQEVTSARGYAERMKMALHVISGMFSIPNAALFVHDPKRQELALLTAKGFTHLGDARLVLPDTETAQLPRNEPLTDGLLQRTGLFAKNANLFTRLNVATAVPLFTKQEFIGVILLGPRLSGNRLQKTERDVLIVAAHQIATAIHNARIFEQYAAQVAENRSLYENMRQIYHDTIQAFATAIDAKDQYTKHHSFRVAYYAAAIARELPWKESDVEAIYVAGLLHDIGKLSLDVDLINKGDGLTPMEQEKIRRHASVSSDIVARIRLPWQEVPRYIRHHHERPDGKGYPDSLHARDLSEGGKILSIADSYDAMTSDRPYRPRLTVKEALSEIRRCTGTQFDGKISSVFSRMIEQGQPLKPLHPWGGGKKSGESTLPHVIDIPWRTNA